ncbi:DUF6175 family protein [Neolewinella agarilytica]|uniref:Uncharacterized protein n=1 Tax=Neolewinella agarilytica TaxID=478744 RepID=A0A1H9CA92_9BACT|nr:DUF6175 family protein [Neolewinella agarilytica]SEP98160.1 hypothetical protein SAMN05444359_104125 [Neolewinella agarilytica]
MRLFSIFLIMLWGVSLAAQENTQTVQPTIMVIPFAKEDEQLRTALEKNEALRIAVSKVKEGFDDRGYSTIDFRSKLNQLGNDQVMESDNVTSLKQMVIELSGADIFVEVEVQKNRSSSGNSVAVVLSAYDAYSSESLANKVGTSPKFYSEDYAKLTTRALGDNVEELLNTIQLKFDDIVANGRTITMNIGFSQASEYDMDSEVGVDEDLLSDVIEDWLYDNSFGNYYHLQGITATKMIVDAFKVPLRDDKGRNFRVSRLASQFRKDFSELGLEITRDVQGNRIFLTIN